MARKRMFDSEVINQDSFFDLPMEAKALYFLLGMEADDEGFVSPRKVLRLYGGTDDSIRLLAVKNFIIPFESGVIVITDWQNNNWLDKRRVKPTIYQDEKNQLLLNEGTGKYELANPSHINCLANAKQMLRENRIEENRIEENRVEENSNNIVDIEQKKKEKTKRNKFVPPTLEEVQAYCIERNNTVDPITFYDYYNAGNWSDAKGNKIKNWKQKLITWEKRQQPKQYQKTSGGNPFFDLLREEGKMND